MEENSSKKSSPNWLTIISPVLIFVALLAILLFFLNGETTMTGEFEGQKNPETLFCESNETAYSIFAFDESDSKSLKVNAVFEDEKLNSISLIYKLNYSDKDTLSFSEARNHAEVNEHFKADGMNPDSLSAKYGIMSDGMQFSIYAKDDDISNTTLKYFMIINNTSTDQLTKEKLSKLYNKVGLNCIIKTNKTEEEVNEN